VACAKIAVASIILGLIVFAPRMWNDGASELQAGKGAPMQVLRERAEQLRRQRVNAAAATAVR
jgi:hypothetical protein